MERKTVNITEKEQNNKYIVNGATILLVATLINKMTYEEGKKLEGVVQVYGEYNEPNTDSEVQVSE